MKITDLDFLYVGKIGTQFNILIYAKSRDEALTTLKNYVIDKGMDKTAALRIEDLGITAAKNGGIDKIWFDCPVIISKYDKRPNVLIEDLDFSMRSYNCLKRAGYNTLDDFKDKTQNDLMRVRNLDAKSMNEIIEICRARGVIIPEKR